ncbi:MAG: sigma-54-dependent Fis family transcriptional regulator, partial [Salinivirgaceae bacterium]|nr:sigma-54-dependent Fis family transcriptional regulator [Salinivirgaceae bacterium]
MEKEKRDFNILIIDDDPIYRNLSRSILKEKFNVFAVEAPSLAFKILKNEVIDVVVCDFKLPEMDGLKVLEIVKKQYPEVEVIMISNSGDMDTVIGALRKGAVDYFKKPFTAAEIWMSIERTRKYSELNKDFIAVKKKNTILKDEVNRELGLSMIGKSAEILNIKQQMEMVAQTPDTSVLIIGESGTGKELVARGIHNMSNRKDEMLGAVNMSAVPESLFESEFFGHAKGSFTGAIADKSGWFETTNKGTLFFDEIGEMSPFLQVKLLRVLEDRNFTKVGTQKEKQFDIRIIAATNKSEETLTDGKSFRLDLFHRLGTFIIHLPPLRERKKDLPELANYFLVGLSKKMGKSISHIHSSVFDLFNNYAFPGNIRELKNLIERAVIVCKGKELLPEHFTIINLMHDSLNQAFESNKTFDLKELEKQTIIRVLQKVNFNKAEAARLLNLEWNAL